MDLFFGYLIQGIDLKLAHALFVRIDLKYTPR